MTRTTTRCTAISGSVSLVLLGAILGNAQTAQEIARTALGSTVVLTVQDESGEPLRYGSGFLVNDGEVVTNFHVVDGATAGYAYLVAQDQRYDVQGVIAVDRDRDIVVLKISAAGLPVLPLGDSDGVQVGDSVYAAGNPQGWQGTFSEGIVSAIRQVDTQELLQITAPISSGSSGGPVLDSAGEVIGIAVSTVRDGQNLNFAIPVNHLKRLLENSGPAKPLASQDDARSLLLLASNYHHGEGVPRDYEEAARLYRIAAEQGSAEAQRALGDMYERGLGVARSDFHAARWYRLAAKQGNADAQKSLGEMYYFGRGVARDFGEAAKWFRRAAEQGHSEAQRRLGEAYISGQGLPVDDVKGEMWIRTAAERGDTRSQSILGFRYSHRGDYAESVRWYRLAADQGDSGAQLSLGNAYYYGRGVSQDYAEAARWFRLAADRGDFYAQSSLGKMYYYGKGVPQNYAEAVKWLRQAAEPHGWRASYDVEARWFLGIMYYFGDGVPQDYVEAARWFRLVADLTGPYRDLHLLGGGDEIPDSQWRLGVMYYLGQGVPQDYTEAARWYRRAAGHGYASAQWSLGSLYRFGIGVSQNLVAAHAWLNLAAAQGHDDATADRDTIALQMTSQQIASAQELAQNLWSQISAD